MYEDVLESIPGLQVMDVDLDFLLALTIVKLRLIAAFLAAPRAVEALQTSVLGSRLGDASDHVTQMLQGGPEEERRIERQREMVDMYLDAIDAKNPSMLPAIINPAPLKNQSPPSYFSCGEPTEAYFSLMRCNRLFVRIPGVELMLERRFGKNPEYNANMSME